MSGENEAFRRLFCAHLDMVRARFQSNGGTASRDLFTVSTFSVSEANAQRIKDELRRIVRDFVDEHEAADGERLCSIVVSSRLSDVSHPSGN